MDVGARHLGMPDGMLTRRVGERLYWKIVITFQLREPRGGRQQLPHMRMPPPHFTVLYMRAPCDGYPFQTSQWPQPALVPHAILQKLEELMQPFGAHPPPHDVIKRDPRYGLLVEKGGTVHSLRTKIAAALASQPGRFHWSSTCDSRHSNVHCTAGLPAGVPDREGCVHFSNATLSKSLAPIAENLALHFALLGGRQQGDAGCEMTAFKVANLVAEADVPVSSTEDAQRIPGIGPACAALVDDAFRRLRAAASRTRQPRAPPAASPHPPTTGKRKRKASNGTPPLCRYCTAAGGKGCYQKNPDHMAKFTHA